MCVCRQRSLLRVYHSHTQEAGSLYQLQLIQSNKYVQERGKHLYNLIIIATKNCNPMSSVWYVMSDFSPRASHVRTVSDVDVISLCQNAKQATLTPSDHPFFLYLLCPPTCSLTPCFAARLALLLALLARTKPTPKLPRPRSPWIQASPSCPDTPV